MEVDPAEAFSADAFVLLEFATLASAPLAFAFAPHMLVLHGERLPGNADGATAATISTLDPTPL